MTVASRSDQVPGYGWLAGLSSWIVLPILGPAVGWIGFLAVGFVSRRRAAIVLGVVLAVVSLTLGIDLWNDLTDIVSAIVHLGGIVAALALNPGWLRTMWERRSRGQSMWSAGTAAAPARRAPRKSRSRGSRKVSGSDSGSGSGSGSRSAADTDAGSTSREEAARLAASVGAGTSDMWAGGEAGEQVDVQTAPAEKLMDLPGMTRTRARRAVKERTRQGGFTSLEDFGETAGLQPHEIVRLRAVATCSPRPRAERRFGRRVDL
ncbi:MULTISPECIES: ComEA family DNA-binding protein [unclassified Microbacterium]|uniref:ComEA family DNA-binding protein n=1 Tax=unclassified Microbacterium TaxID=2609290 RepID=UPI00386BDA73